MYFADWKIVLSLKALFGLLLEIPCALFLLLLYQFGTNALKAENITRWVTRLISIDSTLM